jgi:hypothetical protein
VEDRVEGAAVLAVAVADQEANAALAEVEAEVSRLLGDPRAGRIPGAAGDPDATTPMRDEEEHIEAAQQDRLHGQEVAADHADRLRAQELAPTRTAATRRGLEPRPREQTADGRRGDDEAQLAQLAADAAVPPAWVLARQPERQLADLERQRRTANPA